MGLLGGCLENRAAGVVFTAYAQLAQPPPTALFTTYCGHGGSWIQILGTSPGMSTRIGTVGGGFFAGAKNPWQIKAIAGRDAQILNSRLSGRGLAPRNAAWTR